MSEEQYDNFAICPHCEYRYEDCWEWDDTGECECDECGNWFTWERETKTMYTTEALPTPEVE